MTVPLRRCGWIISHLARAYPSNGAHEADRRDDRGRVEDHAGTGSSPPARSHRFFGRYLRAGGEVGTLETESSKYTILRGNVAARRLRWPPTPHRHEDDHCDDELSRSGDDRGDHRHAQRGGCRKMMRCEGPGQLKMGGPFDIMNHRNRRSEHRGELGGGDPRTEAGIEAGSGGGQSRPVRYEDRDAASF